MTIIESIILGIIQGVTEFLPISSSGHLVLAEAFFKLDIENLKAFDLSLHFGTLMAVLLYFRKDFIEILKNTFSLLKANKEERKTINKMPIYLVLGTIPIVIFGSTTDKILDHYFRNTFSIGILAIAVGLLFFGVEYLHKKIKEKPLNEKGSFLVGIAQALALIPGISRSGITISTALLLGVKREEAAKFSFLLGGIATFAAICLGVLKLFKGEFVLIDTTTLIIGVLTSFLTGIFSIAFLMEFLKKHTLKSFGIYRIILGVIILMFYL